MDTIPLSVEQVNNLSEMCIIKVIKLLFGYGISMILLVACVSTYEVHNPLESDLIVVSGILTDQPILQTISLSRSKSRVDSSGSVPLANATVEVIVNGSATVSFKEIQPGTYQTPEVLQAKPGNTYQLKFRTAEGVSYQSSTEAMTGVPPILRVHDQFNAKGPTSTADGLPTPVNDIYVDYQDPPGTRNFYLWRWRLYESQLWCATCQQGRYVVQDVGPLGSGPINVLGCVLDNELSVSNLYDYACRGLCWDIFYSSRINILADTYTDGQLQLNHKVASVPIYQLDPALISIEQLSLSANAYRYYKLFADQIQNTGTLADSPPAPIAGNVKNVENPQENVIGYFSASSVAVTNYKVIRQNAPVSSGRFQGLFYAEHGRSPNREVSREAGLFNGPAIPSALCIPSHTRTDQLPPGW